MASYKLELLEFSNKLLILRIDGQEFKVPIEMASNRLSAETDLKRGLLQDISFWQWNSLAVD
jgi:hypothetical protein